MNIIIKIAKSKYKLFKEKPTGDFDYNKWVEFIENHKDYFVWYEDTDDGKYRLENMDKVSDWVKESIIYGLNKTTAYRGQSTIRKKNRVNNFIYK